MKHSRVAIIGAGPAGSAAAMALCAHRDIEVIVFERHAMPRRKVCGSGLSPWTLAFLDRMGVGESVRRRAYRIDGARIAGSEGAGVELRGDHETAVLLREEFDYLLVNHAVRRGARLRDGVRVREVVRDGLGRVMGLRADGDEIEVDAVVDCSGANGALTRVERGGQTLHTIMGWYEGITGTSDVVEIFFDTVVRPHYGWIFPETDDRMNVGICFAPAPGKPNARERYAQFIEHRLGHRMRGAHQLEPLVGHPVRTSWRAERLVQPGTLVAGEAGQIVDMATAEGIYHALASGWLAGDVLGGTLERGLSPTPGNLAPYPRLVHRRLGARLAAGRVLMTALRTPMMDFVLQFQQLKTTRRLLSRTFTGLFHG